MNDALATRDASSTPGPRLSRREQAAALAATRRWLFFATTTVGLLAPWLLWSSGLAGAIEAALGSLPVWASLPVYVATLTLLLTLISTPLSFYSGYVVSHRYGLSNQTIGGWLADRLKGIGLVLVIGVAAGSLFYATIWLAPDSWWLLFWLAATAASIALYFVAPYVILPLFYTPKPVDDPGLVTMIADLVQKAGTSVAGVSRLDFSRRTHEANAAVIGFGRSRRVVLADTLLASFTPSEIRAVVAHELGHHVHRDVTMLLTLQAVVMLVGLGLAAVVGDPLLRLLGAEPISDPASYPLLLLAIELFGLIWMPALNALSRGVETRADTYAFNLLGDGRPFAAAMRRLADQNLSEMRPPRWAELLLYTHPPIWRRVERAEAARHG